MFAYQGVGEPWTLTGEVGVDAAIRHSNLPFSPSAVV